MLKNGPFLQRVFHIVDIALIIACIYGSQYILPVLAPALNWPNPGPVNLFLTDTGSTIAAVILIPILLRRCGFYRKNNLQHPARAFQQLAVALLWALAGIALYQMARNIQPHLRHLLWINIVLIPCVLYIRYLICYFYLSHISCSPHLLRSAVLFGKRAEVEARWEQLPHLWRRTFNVVGTYHPDEQPIEELQKTIVKHNVSQVFLFNGLSDIICMREAFHMCELQGIDIYIAAAFTHSPQMHFRFETVASQHFCICRNAPVLSWPLFFKSVFDRIGALILIVLTSPLWLVAAVGIKLSDPKGPVFYRQKRSGLHGKEFSMWKFRSMYTDAEERLEEVKATLGNDMKGPIFKLANDPRIIPFGKFIRKTSIDELPQLLNILRGDMSLVGPRPLPVYETDALPDFRDRRRMSVKPGLTCYWQIEGRSDTTEFNDIIAKDLKYIDNWNFWLDIWLLLRTVPAVLFARGAK